MSIDDATNLDQKEIQKHLDVINKTEGALLVLKESYSHVPTQEELEEPENYEYAKEACKELAKRRNAVDKASTSLKKPYLEAQRKINAEAKSIKERILEIEEPIKSALKQFDDKAKRAEEERKNKIYSAIEEIRATAFRHADKTSEEIEQEIERLNTMDFSLFMEHEIDAMKARNEAVKMLGICLETAIRKEQDLVNEHIAINGSGSFTDAQVEEFLSDDETEIPERQTSFSETGLSVIKNSVIISVSSSSPEFCVLRELLGERENVSEFFDTLASDEITITLRER